MDDRLGLLDLSWLNNVCCVDMGMGIEMEYIPYISICL